MAQLHIRLLPGSTIERLLCNGSRHRLDEVWERRFHMGSAEIAKIATTAVRVTRDFPVHPQCEPFDLFSRFRLSFALHSVASAQRPTRSCFSAVLDAQVWKANCSGSCGEGDLD
jgi:hypothetical protein